MEIVKETKIKLVVNVWDNSLNLYTLRQEISDWRNLVVITHHLQRRKLYYVINGYYAVNEIHINAVINIA